MWGTGDWNDSLRGRITSSVVIGYGSIGRYHARLLSGRYRHLGVVDINEAARKRATDDLPMAVLCGSLADLDAVGWPWENTLAVIATWGPSHSTVFGELVDRGVTRILCEKPIAHSVSRANAMIETARRQRVVLGVHQHLRYSGLVPGMRQVADTYGLGEPFRFLVFGGAAGIVNTGIHWIDVAAHLYGKKPESVVSSAVGDPINPRSPDLMLFGGTVAWDFGEGQEAVFSFSNNSSIDRIIYIVYRNAIVRLFRNLEVEIYGRAREDVDKFPAVTRLGEPKELLLRGPVPGMLPTEQRTIRLLEEIEAGSVRAFPPDLAVCAVEACIGALSAGKTGQRVRFPIEPDSDAGRAEWPIS